MEQTNEETLFNLQLDHDSGSHLKETAKWSRFLSIISFICIGFGLVAIVFGAQAMSEVIRKAMPGMEAFSGVMVGAIGVALVILTWTTILLYRFSNLTSEGIRRQDQELFRNGIKALKNYFTIYGFFSVLGLLINVGTFIFELTKN